MAVIEKAVKEECLKIYTGNNVKFLTGTHRIPDYLRKYLENMKTQCEEFRIDMCRQLRNTTIELAELSPKIRDLLLDYNYRKIIMQLEK